ncbi:integrase catalytic domain-containing protein [Trichonephila clavipes]|nr:integrase catalytic domain-containing protein [Trichonephila clavipes]
MIKLPDHTLAEFLTNESIEWNFIPPRSPNHGGLWEAGVKAFKFHLKRVVGNAHITLEEFITILCEIEAVLNSRPLTPLTSNFDDFETLTPGHFLVGRPLTSIVEAQITNINENQLSRWEKKPSPGHGQRSSHNNTVLPILPVDMQFEILCFPESMYGNNIYLAIKIIRIMIVLRQSLERNKAPTESEALEPGPVGPCLKTPLAIIR